MRVLPCLLLLAVMIGPGSAIFAGEMHTGARQGLVTMNFENADISAVAKFISGITGKNFVLDDSVRGKISVFAPAKVTPAQAYCIFLSALQLKGFAAVSAGPAIKIMPSRDARTFAPLTRSQTPAGECAQPVDPSA